MVVDREKVAGTVTGCYRILDGKIIINVNNSKADLQNNGGCGQRITKLELF